MNLMINNSSMQPIYEQIMEQIKQLVLTGKLKEEAPLPSVRSLSKDLKISALTVKKAYDKLEEEGFIITVHGKGSFIAPTNRDLMMEENRRQVEADLESAVRKGKSCGMSKEELTDLFSLIVEEMESC
ncbi:MAG: GntR family transcriptional regulator [Lachnospiraceae bacterium]|nr:GntR family transcriptional regulator [Lachnospiraceae bacterium]